MNRQLPRLGNGARGEIGSCNIPVTRDKVNRQLPHLGPRGERASDASTAGQGDHQLLLWLADRLCDVRVCCGELVARRHVGRCRWLRLVGVFLDPPYLGDIAHRLTCTQSTTTRSPTRSEVVPANGVTRGSGSSSRYLPEHDHLIPDVRGREAQWSSSAAYSTTASAARGTATMTTATWRCFVAVAALRDTRDARSLDMFGGVTPCCSHRSMWFSPDAAGSSITSSPRRPPVDDGPTEADINQSMQRSATWSAAPTDRWLRARLQIVEDHINTCVARTPSYGDLTAYCRMDDMEGLNDD